MLRLETHEYKNDRVIVKLLDNTINFNKIINRFKILKNMNIFAIDNCNIQTLFTVKKVFRE